MKIDTCLDNHRHLAIFLKEPPEKYFEKLGIKYVPDKIGFDLIRGNKTERFDFPFHRDAIGEEVAELLRTEGQG